MKLYIFDWKQTLYNPGTKSLIDGAVDVLKLLKQNETNSLALIGKGGQNMHNEVKRLGVKDYFSHINFREGPKDVSLYTSLIKKRSLENIVFIGDRVRSELAVGNSLGAITIWVKQGEFATEEPENPIEQPTYTVTSLIELKEFLQRL